MATKRDATLTLMTCLQKHDLGEKGLFLQGWEGRHSYGCRCPNGGSDGDRQRAPSSPCATGSQRLIFRHSGIDAIRPGQDSAGEIVNLLKSRLLQEGDCFRAADAGAAMGHDLAA